MRLSKEPDSAFPGSRRGHGTVGRELSVLTLAGCLAPVDLLHSTILSEFVLTTILEPDVDLLLLADFENIVRWKVNLPWRCIHPYKYQT